MINERENNMGKKGSMLARDMLVGLAMLGVIILIIAIIIIVILFVRKGIGVLLILFGIFMMVGFPDIKDLQAHEMSQTGILIGIILIIIGALLLIYL